ncbi:MAG: hypothetical protein EOM91_20050 [Sphingobacteriia bacterium]|nr:hypothetical protein [Sphingobacteriia bacterium]
MIATDNDPGGRVVADQIAALVGNTGRANGVILRAPPLGARQDRNDVLVFGGDQSGPALRRT